MLKFLNASLAILIPFCSAFSQKKPLDHSVYDGWQTVQSTSISRDGNFVQFLVVPQEGDSELFIKERSGNPVMTVPRAKNISFDKAGTASIFLISPFYQDLRQAKIKKKKPDEMPKDTLGIVNLSSKELFKYPNVKSYKMPAESAHIIAFLAEEVTKNTPKDTTARDTTTKATPQARGSRNKKIATLYLRSLTTGTQERFENVVDYAFSKNGNFLTYSVSIKDSVDSISGLYLYDVASKASRKISSGKGTYKHLTFDDNEEQLSFVAEKNPEKALRKPYQLYYLPTTSSDTAAIIAHVSSSGMPKDWNVSGDGSLRFSKNGEKLFFGIAPIPRIKDTTIVDFEVANVDIWHYQDDYLQPQQLVNLRRDLSKSYLSVIYPKRTQKNVIPLASIEIPDVVLTKDADNEYAVATSNYGRRISSQWNTSSTNDIFLISTVDGSSTKIVDSIEASAMISPQGKYLLWYDASDKNWYSYDIDKKQKANLTGAVQVAFADEENDSPAEARAYGIAGWGPEDKLVYIYDRYDIWSFEPNSNKYYNLTNNEGRSKKIVFRYQHLDQNGVGPMMRFSAPVIEDKEVLLTAFNEENKYNGYYRTQLGKARTPKELVMAPMGYRQLQADEDKKVFVYTKENYTASPNVYLSTDLTKETQLSQTNTQQGDYNWGTAELFHWTTPNGHQASGILYKPEDFDETKQYPVIAYFYEKLTEGLYSYIAPAPTPSRLNISYFVSNGYIVFAPDISYEIGHPGKSAEEFINSGMAELAKKTWVNEKALGIQGQSWGGYQVSHLITRTDMYAAAWAGAPVANMTSAYGGIRWGSGMSRQFQYEKTQSRIGKDLWEGYDLYIENSPLFHFRNVTTPVVVMHNDNDGAVPWYQGIEMFTALRRLGKPVWMLNYNGEEHNLVKRQNRKDIQIREQQFFDHYLKGKPAPVWLAKGVPATLKGIDWGFDLIEQE